MSNIGSRHDQWNTGGNNNNQGGNNNNNNNNNGQNWNNNNNNPFPLAGNNFGLPMDPSMMNFNPMMPLPMQPNPMMGGPIPNMMNPNFNLPPMNSMMGLPNPMMNMGNPMMGMMGAPGMGAPGAMMNPINMMGMFPNIDLNSMPGLPTMPPSQLPNLGPGGDNGMGGWNSGNNNNNNNNWNNQGWNNNNNNGSGGNQGGQWNNKNNNNNYNNNNDNRSGSRYGNRDNNRNGGNWDRGQGGDGQGRYNNNNNNQGNRYGNNNQNRNNRNNDPRNAEREEQKQEQRRKEEEHQQEVKDAGGQHYFQHMSVLAPDHQSLHLPWLPAPQEYSSTAIGFDFPPDLIGADFSQKTNSSRLHDAMKRDPKFRDFIQQTTLCVDHFKLRFKNYFNDIQRSWLRPELDRVYHEFEQKKANQMSEWTKIDTQLARQIGLNRLMEEKAKDDLFSNTTTTTAPATDQSPLQNDENSDWTPSQLIQLQELNLPLTWTPTRDDFNIATEPFYDTRRDFITNLERDQKGQEHALHRVAIDKLATIISTTPLAELHQPLKDISSANRHKMAPIYALVRVGGPGTHFHFASFPVYKLVRAYLENFSAAGAAETVNTVFPEQDSTLAHRAAWNGDVDTLRTLIEFGATTNRYNIYNEIPSACAYASFLSGKINRTNLDNVSRILNSNMSRGIFVDTTFNGFFQDESSTSNSGQSTDLQGTQIISGVQVTERGCPSWVDGVIVTQLERLNKIRKIKEVCKKRISALHTATVQGKRSLIRQQENELKRLCRKQLLEVDEAVRAKANWVYVSGIPFSYPIQHVVEWFKPSGPILAVHFPQRSKKSYSTAKVVEIEEEIEVEDDGADEQQPTTTTSTETITTTPTTPFDSNSNPQPQSSSLADMIDNAQSKPTDQTGENTTTSTATKKMKKIKVTKTKKIYQSSIGEQDMGHGGVCIILFKDVETVENALKYDHYPLLGRTIRVTPYRLTDQQRIELKWKHQAAREGVEYDDAYHDAKIKQRKLKLKEELAAKRKKIEALTPEEKEAIIFQKKAKIAATKQLYKERVKRRNDALQEALAAKLQQKRENELKIQKEIEETLKTDLYLNRKSSLDNVIPIENGWLSNDPEPRWYANIAVDPNKPWDQDFVYFLHLPYEFTYTDVLDLIQKETGRQVKRWAMPMRQLKLGSKLDMDVLVNCAIDGKWIHTCKMVVQFSTAMDASEVLLAMDGMMLQPERKTSQFDKLKVELAQQRQADAEERRRRQEERRAAAFNAQKQYQEQMTLNNNANGDKVNSTDENATGDGEPEQQNPFGQTTTTKQVDSSMGDVQQQQQQPQQEDTQMGDHPQPPNPNDPPPNPNDPYLNLNSSTPQFQFSQFVSTEPAELPKLKDVQLRVVRKLKDVKFAPEINKSNEKSLRASIVAKLNDDLDLTTIVNIVTKKDDKKGQEAKTLKTMVDEQENTATMTTQALQAALHQQRQVSTTSIIGRSTADVPMTSQKRVFSHLEQTENTVEVPIHSATVQSQQLVRKDANDVQTRHRQDKKQRLAQNDQDAQSMVQLDQGGIKEEGEVEDDDCYY